MIANFYMKDFVDGKPVGKKLRVYLQTTAKAVDCKILDEHGMNTHCNLWERNYWKSAPYVLNQYSHHWRLAARIGELLKDDLCCNYQ